VLSVSLLALVLCNSGLGHLGFHLRRLIQRSPSTRAASYLVLQDSGFLANKYFSATGTPHDTHRYLLCSSMRVLSIISHGHATPRRTNAQWLPLILANPVFHWKTLRPQSPDLNIWFSRLFPVKHGFIRYMISEHKNNRSL
jgi:hypothetical protein